MKDRGGRTILRMENVALEWLRNATAESALDALCYGLFISYQRNAKRDTLRE